MSENHVKNHVDGIPGRNGGTLRNGGTNKGGTGRPKNEIRADAALGYDEALPGIKEIAKDPAHPQWKYAVDFLIKTSGLQQTDVTSGDAPVKSVVIDASTLPTEQLDAILASE